MDDLISRQAAIDEVQRHRENVLGGYEYDEGVAFVYAAAHNHIIEVIKCIPSAQQWIPCSERLPEYMNIVLVSYHRQVRFGCRTQHDKEYPWYIMFGHCFNVKEKEVIAWMPLPEPYREEVSD